MHKKECCRLLSWAMCLILVFMHMPMVTLAEQPNTPKEEVVYVNMNPDGSVKEIYVVNIFDLDENGQVIDYGRYQNLRNMTTTDTIQQTDNKVTIDAKEGKLYYEGKLEGNVMPWDVAISYYLDGVQCTAQEIAGASGSLRIRISIQKNKLYSGNFFEGFALQGIVTMDTLLADNIHANGATIANVGRSKQLTYTILPGKGAEIEITADVVDFEMEGISFNGIPLQMDLEVDDEELLSQVRQLMDAIAQIDDGAAELVCGVESVRSGSADLRTGASELSKGALSLEEGAQDLKTGIDQVGTALNTLNSQSSALDDGSSAVVSGLKQLQNSANFDAYKAVMLENGLDINLVQNGNTAVINAVNDLSAWLAEAEAKLLELGLPEEELKPIRDGYTEVSGTVLGLMTGNNAVITGTQSYLNALGSAAGTLAAEYEKIDSGIGSYTDAVAQITSGYADISKGALQVAEGTTSVRSGAQSLHSGTSAMASGINTLGVGIGTLQEGTSSLRQETEGMDVQIRNQINTLIRSMTGADVETGSFVSNANTHVESVQFVIKTEGIEQEVHALSPETPDAPKSFWQKLLALFGIQ